MREKPQGNWIDAKQAFYVLGSKKTDSMSPTLAAFAIQQDAGKFAKEFGKVLPFNQVTADMVDLTCGVVHEKKIKETLDSAVIWRWIMNVRSRHALDFTHLVQGRIVV